MHMWCMHFHSLPVCDPQNQVGVIGLTGMIQKDKARRVDTAEWTKVSLRFGLRPKFNETFVHSDLIDFAFITS